MIDGQFVKSLIKERSEFHPEDYISEEKFYTKISELLGNDVVETIEFLESCSQFEIYWLSSCFEDISYKLQSKEFIKYLKTLDKKYPDADITVDVEFAEKALN